MIRPASLALLAAALLLACDRDVPSPPDGRADGVAVGAVGDVAADSRRPAPRAELLLEAGDSTFWVRSGPEGIRLRGSPVLLARVDGRFQELYLADDDHSFYDAVFVGQRLWRRDLITGDSVVVLGDSLVDAAARRWARRHPGAELLAPDEEESDDPASVATGEIEVLDVFGPWATIEHSVDIDVQGEGHVHARRRAVIDLRNGRRASLAALVGVEAARATLAVARERYAAALDSVRLAHDERGRRAARAIASFPFDSTSFGLTALDGAPVVTFLVPGHGEDGGGRALTLAPVAVAPPAWWSDVAPTLPRSVGDSVDRWNVPGLVVEARARGDNARLRLVLRDSAGHSWPAGNVPWPSRWLVRLDRPAIDSATRRGLARAFDESALYSEDARTVSHGHAPSRRPSRAGRHARGARLVSAHAGPPPAARSVAARRCRLHLYPRT